MQAALPGGRGMPPVGSLKSQQADSIAGPKEGRVIENGDKLRVEVDVDAARVIIEFEVGQQRNVGEDIFYKERFTPTAVPDNQIRAETLIPQTSAGICCSRSGRYSTIQLDGISM